MASALDENFQHVLVTGQGTDCFSDEQSALLAANDLNDPQTALLRNQLLTLAQADCIGIAMVNNYTNYNCDPFSMDFEETGFEEIFQLVGEQCQQAIQNGLEGTPLKKGAVCPDMPADSAGPDTTSTTTDGDTDTDTLIPTTGGGLQAMAAGELDAMISCDEDACHVSQTLIDTLLTNPDVLLNDPTRLRQEVKKGEVLGMKFTGVSAGSLADRLGFKNGDVIVAVDGLPFRTPEEFIAVAAAIFDADEVTVTTQRDHKLTDHVFMRE